MRKILPLLVLALPLLAAGPKPKVKVTTNLGAFVLQLEPDATPKTVQNFLAYVHKGQYNGTIFHRVKRSAPGIVQGGGLLPDLTKKSTDPSIVNEADLAKAHGLSNTRGTVAMARESLPDSAKAQFYVNTVDNVGLDFKKRTLGDFGYCVFGKVVSGMEVVDRIGHQKTHKAGGMDDVPVTPVVITNVSEVK
jgi:cyclophilin family peptidyl-prolyl cis-trans isomerase